MMNYAAIATQSRGAGMGCFDIFRELFSRFEDTELSSVIFVMNHSVVSANVGDDSKVDYEALRDSLCKRLSKETNPISQYIVNHNHQVVMMSGYNLDDTKARIMKLINEMRGRSIDKNRFNFSGLADLKYDAATRLLDEYISGAEAKIQLYLNLYKKAKSIHDFLSDKNTVTDPSSFVIKGTTPSEKIAECQEMNKILMVEIQRNIEDCRRQIESFEEGKTRKLFEIAELDSDILLTVSTKEREMRRGWFSSYCETIEYRCSHGFEIRAQELFDGELQEEYTNNWAKGVYRKTYSVGIFGSAYFFKILIQQQKRLVFHQKIVDLKEDIRKIDVSISFETEKIAQQQKKMEEIKEDMRTLDESNIHLQEATTARRVLQSKKYVSSKVDEIKGILDGRDVKRFIVSREIIIQRMELISELVQEFGNDIGVIAGACQPGWFAEALEELRNIDFEAMRLPYFLNNPLVHYPSLDDEYSQQTPVLKYVPLSDITPVSEPKRVFGQAESVLSFGLNNWLPHAREFISGSSFGISQGNAPTQLENTYAPTSTHKIHDKSRVPPLQDTMDPLNNNAQQQSHQKTAGSATKGTYLDGPTLRQFFSDAIDSGLLTIGHEDRKNFLDHLELGDYDGSCIECITMQELLNDAKVKHGPAHKILKFIKEYT